MSEPPGGRAQSSPIGVVLLLGLTLTAAVGIVVVGGDAIQSTQSRSEVGQAEQAMTQFDARAAQVALGDSNSQTVSLGGQGGSYTVAEDVGRVKLLHEDWNGTDCDSCEEYASFSNTTDDGNTTILYDRTLGALVYESGDATVAYQGGGVWRKGDEGTARPVSSPEFHYRDATLTFPLVSVDGSGGASGQVKANVQRVETATAVYPNTSETYPAGERTLVNPVQRGNMSVEVTSDYCEGWRTYFRERTEGDVSECEEGTVTADIITLGLQGDFSVIGGEELPVRGQDGLESFEITLTDDDSQTSKFNDLGWSMSAENGDRELELSIQGGGNVEVGDPVTVAIYYSYDGTVYDGWIDNQSFVVEDNGAGPEVTVDFLASEEANWSELDGSSDLEQFHPDTRNATRPAALGSADEPIADIVQHYFDRIGDVDFRMNEKNAANLDDSSTGNIRYQGGDNVVTYLHVTENRVDVELS